MINNIRMLNNDTAELGPIGYNSLYHFNILKTTDDNWQQDDSQHKSENTSEAIVSSK